VFGYQVDRRLPDTLGDLFARLCPEQLQAGFLSRVNPLVSVSGGEIVAIDGKTLRRIGWVESERHEGDKITTESRYFIGSIEADAEVFARAVRTHWSIPRFGISL
jgi:hypothetical protein